MKNLISALAVFGALTVLRGMASGKWVYENMIVRRHWFLSLVLGRGPTQSIMTQEKGSVETGIGFSGVAGGFWLDFPTT